MNRPLECPYGPNSCPKLNQLENEVETLKKNQMRLMRTVYYIAGIVSVTLGIQVIL